MDKLVSKVLIQGRSTISRRKNGMELPLLQMFRNDKMSRRMYHIARMMTIHPTYSICQQCGTSELVGHYGRWKQKILKYSKGSSRQFSAMTSLLLRSPTFNQLLNLQDQQLRLFHSTSVKQDQERKKDSQSSHEEQQNEENEDDEAKRKSEFKRMAYATVAIILMSLFFSTVDNNPSSSSLKFISWNEFYHNMLLKGEVASIELRMGSEETGEDSAVIEVQDGAVIKGHMSSSKVRYVVKVPKGFNFEEKVRQLEDELGMAQNDRIPIKYHYTSPVTHALIYLAVAAVVISVYMAFFKRMTKSKDGNMTDMIDMLSGKIRQAKFTRVDIASRGAKAISFKDVAGLKEAKIEVMEFVDYLTNPLRYQKLGAKTPRGALLLGPPGCGKTLLARALATEAKVPFLAMAGSEFVEMIGGVGAARVRDLFKEARARAPCIIYVDEVDAIGRMRGGSGSSGGEDEHTLNQLLVEMDGIGTQEGVIIIAATNRADILDKALLRPGRFDRHIMIDLPTLQEREEIFTVYLEKLKLAQSASVYAKPLSRLSPGMSGADINNICNEAAIHAARNDTKVIDTKDFEYAVERVIAGAQKKTSLLSPTEKKVVAYHESGHALVGWLLESTDALLRISIVPRTNSALGLTQYLPSDQHLYSQEELFERMCMALGGRAAESLTFNHVSTGAHDDLQRVTDMAYNQIRSYGMNERIGHLSFPSDKEEPGQRPFSQRLSQTMDEEARKLVARAFLNTQTVLQNNKDKLNILATTLLEKEVLNYDDIEKLIGPPPHGKKNTIEPHGWEGIMPAAKPSAKKKKK